MFKVFIVDAHEAERVLNVRVLNELNCDVTEFADSAGVLEALTSVDDLRVIFIDLDVPPLNGMEFFDTVLFFHPALPLVVTTVNRHPTIEVLLRTSHILYRFFGTFTTTGIKLILNAITGSKN